MSLTAKVTEMFYPNSKNYYFNTAIYDLSSVAQYGASELWMAVP